MVITFVKTNFFFYGIQACHNGRDRNGINVMVQNLRNPMVYLCKEDTYKERTHFISQEKARKMTMFVYILLYAEEWESLY